MTELPLVMGILNVTPDSFSDGGRYLDHAAAIEHGRALIAEGADLVDVGGESTRPGAEEVDRDTELARVQPVIEALSPHIRVSIDTTKPDVARAAVAAGATLINDVSGSLSPVAAELGVGWVAMHRRGTPATMQSLAHYDDVVAEVAAELTRMAEAARRGAWTRSGSTPASGSPRPPSTTWPCSPTSTICAPPAFRCWWGPAERRSWVRRSPTPTGPAGPGRNGRSCARPPSSTPVSPPRDRSRSTTGSRRAWPRWPGPREGCEDGTGARCAPGTRCSHGGRRLRPPTTRRQRTRWP